MWTRFGDCYIVTIVAVSLWWQYAESLPNSIVSFSPPMCGSNQTIDGALVHSQDAQFYTQQNYSCSLILQASPYYDNFMLQFLLVDINCEDASLSVYDVDQQVFILEGLCGQIQQVPDKGFHSLGKRLNFTWTTHSSNAIQSKGFRFTITAYRPKHLECLHDKNYVCQSDGRCININLLCDGVSHCLDLSDESVCNMATKTASTTAPPVATNPVPSDKVEEDIYMWVPLLAVVVVALFIILVMVLTERKRTPQDGRRISRRNRDRASQRSEAETIPIANAESNGNMTVVGTEEMTTQFVNEGDRVSMTSQPPNYSSLGFDRQISNMSTITQTSDQISMPPGYEEAIYFGENPPGSPTSPTAIVIDGATIQNPTSPRSLQPPSRPPYLRSVSQPHQSRQSRHSRVRVPSRNHSFSLEQSRRRNASTDTTHSQRYSPHESTTSVEHDDIDRPVFY